MHIAQIPVDVGGNDRLGFGCNGLLGQFRIDAPTIGQYIYKNRFCPQMNDWGSGCNPVGIRQDNLVTRPYSKSSQSHVKCSGAT